MDDIFLHGGETIGVQEFFKCSILVRIGGLSWN
jgi:hypothetical protein